MSEIISPDTELMYRHRTRHKLSPDRRMMLRVSLQRWDNPVQEYPELRPSTSSGYRLPQLRSLPVASHLKLPIRLFAEDEQLSQPSSKKETTFA